MQDTPVFLCSGYFGVFGCSIGVYRHIKGFGVEGFPKLGVRIGGSQYKDYSALGSRSGSPNFRELHLGFGFSGL